MDIKFSDIKKAAEVLSGVIKKTDLIYSDEFSKISGNEVYFKPENLQKTGAFKIRGAYNKIANLDSEEKKAGVIASSAGNHAQGVAYAAREYGIDAVIVMPQNAPISKVTATEEYGAQVVLAGNNYDEAYERALELQQESGAVFVHPFNDPEVIAGQGTIFLEIYEQLKEVDYVLVPVGGGGLISGIALAAQELSPRTKIIGVEFSSAPVMTESLKNGRIYKQTQVNSIADGIAVKQPGDVTFEVCKECVDGMLKVSEDEIANAILTLLEREKLIIEGAGATTLAVLMYDKLKVKDKTVVPLLSGGNIDINLVSRIINRGLVKANRRIVVKTVIQDRPGRLQKLLKIIADLDANVVSISHDHNYPDIQIGETLVSLNLEIRNKEHAERIYEKLQAEEYGIVK